MKQEIRECSRDRRQNPIHLGPPNPPAFALRHPTSDCGLWTVDWPALSSHPARNPVEAKNYEYPASPLDSRLSTLAPSRPSREIPLNHSIKEFDYLPAAYGRRDRNRELAKPPQNAPICPNSNRINRGWGTLSQPSTLFFPCFRRLGGYLAPCLNAACADCSFRLRKEVNV